MDGAQDLIDGPRVDGDRFYGTCGNGTSLLGESSKLRPYSVGNYSTVNYTAGAPSSIVIIQGTDMQFLSTI